LRFGRSRVVHPLLGGEGRGEGELFVGAGRIFAIHPCGLNEEETGASLRRRFLAFASIEASIWRRCDLGASRFVRSSMFNASNSFSADLFGSTEDRFGFSAIKIICGENLETRRVGAPGLQKRGILVFFCRPRALTRRLDENLLSCVLLFLRVGQSINQLLHFPVHGLRLPRLVRRVPQASPANRGARG